MRAPKARAEKNHMIMTYQEKAENTNDTQVDPPLKICLKYYYRIQLISRTTNFDSKRAEKAERAEKNDP